MKTTMDDDDDDDNKGDTHIARLLAIAGQCEFYLDQYRIPHVSFPLDGRLETARLENDVLQLFLVREYCRLYEHAAQRDGSSRRDAEVSGPTPGSAA